MWECLLEITFQCSQHKIDFGRVLGSILGGFGLHFGRFFGAKSEKVAFQSGSKSKPKKSAIKSHAANFEKFRPEGGPALRDSFQRERISPRESLPGNLSQGVSPREALPGSVPGRHSQGASPRESLPGSRSQGGTPRESLRGNLSQGVSAEGRSRRGFLEGVLARMRHLRDKRGGGYII